MKTKIIVLLLLLFTAFAAVKADGAFIPPQNYQHDLYEPNQRAIIKYDSGVETLMLQVKYQGSNLTEFIWVIPMPDIPVVTEGNAQLYMTLSQITAPQVKRSWNAPQMFFGAAKMSAAESISPDDYLVNLISREQVGIYDVSVLTAKKSQTLIDWMNTRGYKLDQSALQMVEDYLNNDWYFVAVRVNVTNYTNHYNGELPPLQFVFNSSLIVYPLRISSINPGSTEVLAYVFADQKVKPVTTAGWSYVPVTYKLEFAGRTGPGLEGFANKEYFVTKVRMKFNESNPIQSDIFFNNYGDNKTFRMIVDEHGNEVKESKLQMLWDALAMIFRR